MTKDQILKILADNLLDATPTLITAMEQAASIAASEMRQRIDNILDSLHLPDQVLTDLNRMNGGMK